MESETIKFNEAEGKDGFLIKEDSTMIHVYPSRSSQKVSSSKVKLTNVVDYAWDVQHGVGRLLAPHYSGKFVAYCIKVANVGAVRVVDLNTQDRVLMKGSRGLIKDVEFMHKSDDMVLGFIDEYGSFYIYKIIKDLKTNKMQTAMIFQVSLEGSPSRLDCRRFIWCKFVPDELNDIATPRDYAYHFAVCEDSVVYVANLVQLVQKFGEGSHTLPSLKGHYMTIDGHTGSVVDASFSPDGTALATASRDGTVKFFQVYLMGEDVPRCLYSWSPHDGNPVTKIFFLDDHTLNNPSETQYWKYMITAGSKMSELKLWTCTSWECLQTIRFCSPTPSSLKMDININAKFLVLSDVHRKVMFVLNMEHGDDGARFNWINEFSLPVNMIGFNVRDASFVNNRQISERGFEHFVSENDSQDASACIVDVIFVHPKSLMEAAVAFRPPTEIHQQNGRSHSRISFDDSVSFKDDDEEDAKLEADDEEEEEILEPQESVPKDNIRLRSRSASRSPSRIPTPVAAQPNRTPSKSPIRRSSSPRRTPSSAASVTQMTQQLSSLMGVGVPTFGNNLAGSVCVGHVEGSTGQSPNFHGMNLGRESTGPVRIRTSSDNGNLSNASSSPSREVEEILSPKNNEGMIRNKLDTGYNNMETEYAVNNLDVEGNILHSRDLTLGSPKGFQKLPIKVKSLGGGELGGTQLPHVLEQVNSIMDMMKTQALEMQELKREVSRLNNAQNVASRQLDEGGMSRVMDKYFTQNQSCLQRLEDTMKTTVYTMERQQASASHIPPNLVENVSATVGHAVRTEIEKRVLPQLVKVFEPAKHQINNDIEKLVKAAEGRVKEQVSHIFNGQDFKNSLIPDLSKSMRSVCDGVVTQIFTTSVVPNFEKALQNIFIKVNETFMAGTKEYLGALEASLASGRIQNENAQDAVREQLSNMQDNLSSILQVELETHMMQVLGSLQGGVVKKIEESMSKELSRAFREQQRYFEISVIPRTVTPAVSVCDQTSSPAVDPAALQRQVLGMIEAGDITGAFVKASNCADNNLLMTIATRVRPTEVFTRNLPTNAHLALIQQMAMDIISHTETKLAYLQTAIGSLNLNDPKVLKSLSRIIPVFNLSVKTFLDLNPDSPLTGSVKLLEMAFVGIGNRLHQQHVTPTARQERMSGSHLLHSQQPHHYLD